MREKKICCDIFTEYLNEAGRKGFSIIPVPYENTFRFFLQSRSKEYGEVDNIPTFVVEGSINYCPWCGCYLVDIISKNHDEISELSLKNNHLIEWMKMFKDTSK